MNQPQALDWCEKGIVTDLETTDSDKSAKSSSWMSQMSVNHADYDRRRKPIRTMITLRVLFTCVAALIVMYIVYRYRPGLSGKAKGQSYEWRSSLKGAGGGGDWEEVRDLLVDTGAGG